MSIFGDKLKWKRFEFFEERAFNLICTNLHKIIKNDFTFDSKHRQDGHYNNVWPNRTDMMYTETIFYEYLIKKNKHKKRVSIYFDKYFIANKKDLMLFERAYELPSPLNDTKFIGLHKTEYKYPSAYVLISDDFYYTNAKLIRYEYEKQSDKIKIDTYVTKKCVKLIQKETTEMIKKIFTNN